VRSGSPISTSSPIREWASQSVAPASTPRKPETGSWSVHRSGRLATLHRMNDAHGQGSGWFDEPTPFRAGFSTWLLRRRALASNVAGDRIRCAEALSENAAVVEDEAQCEPRMREPEPLEGGLGQDECFGLFERDHIG
jgi:hypothetical protein